MLIRGGPYTTLMFVSASLVVIDMVIRLQLHAYTTMGVAFIFSLSHQMIEDDDNKNNMPTTTK